MHERAATAIEELFADKLDDHLSALAQHYSRSGNAPKAVAFLRRAAEQARMRSAYDDAIRYLNEALGLLPEMPDSVERDRNEVALQGNRVPILATIHGFSSAELAESLNRGLALCQRFGEGPELFTVMLSLWRFNLSRNRMHDAKELAEKILNLSRLMNSEVAQAAAFCALGSTCLWRGQFDLACQHLEQAIAIYDRDIPRYLPMGQALVPSRSQMSWALWMTGYSDQAQKRAAEALDLATRLGNPFSMAFTLMYTIALGHFRGDYTDIRIRAESLLQIARENGFPYWSAVASMVIGRVLVGEGNFDAGIIRMRDAMSTLQEVGGELIHSYAFTLLTESYLRAREPEKGLAAVAEALKGIEASGQRMHEAEIWRLRGELLILRRGADTEAENSFQRALQIARLQQARAWELRAATNLAGLQAAHNRRDEAKAGLVPVVASFTEGFADRDFKEAAALLSQLD